MPPESLCIPTWDARCWPQSQWRICRKWRNRTAIWNTISSSGERGSRYAHVEAALQTLTGAEAALVVNNNAAAVFLALQALATGEK